MEVGHISQKALDRQAVRSPKDKAEQLEMFLIAEGYILMFLSGLIEGRITYRQRGAKTRDNFDVSTSLVSSLNPDILIESMNSHYKGTLSGVNERLANAQEKNLFLYYSFMTALIEIEKQESEAGREFARKFVEWRGGARGVDKIMGRIEVLNGARELEVLYFQIP